MKKIRQVNLPESEQQIWEMDTVSLARLQIAMGAFVLQVYQEFSTTTGYFCVLVSLTALFPGPRTVPGTVIFNHVSG